MPKLIIDKREIDVPSDTKVIEAAEQLGIVIPRFCYHPALGSVGACRVCAVAFKEGPIKGVQMSCMVEAQEGMVVSTTDEEAVDFRRHVIEWLMLHHPHDCPVCDEGGHCLLQDTTIAGGHGLRRYKGPKRTHIDQYLGPLVQHEMNRCIQCYRCTRYYQEFTGYRDLGVMGIGSRVYFGRSHPGCLESPFSGNLVDICPTGVYTDKPSRYFGRRWEFERFKAVCIHCSLGCNLTVSTRYRQVVRHEARHNDFVNRAFICDRGRYAHTYASADNRPRRVRISGLTQPNDNVFDQVIERLEQIANRFGPKSIAAVGSMRNSLETLEVLAKVCEKNHWVGPVTTMTSRNAQNLETALSHLSNDSVVTLSEIATADMVVVIGCDPLNEAPMLALSLRQVVRRGGHVVVIDPRAIALPFEFDHWPAHPDNLGAVIQKIIDSIVNGNGGNLVKDVSERLPKIIQQLLWSKKAVVVCGTDIGTPRDISLAAGLVEVLCSADVNTGLFYVFAGANATACGLIKNETVNSMAQIVDEIEKGRIKALLFVENDAWQQFPDLALFKAALERLELLIVMDYVASPLNDIAHYFIPTQTIYEAGGQWINQEGRLQISQPVFKGGEPIAITAQDKHPPRVFERQIPGSQPTPAWRILLNLIPKNKNNADHQGKEALDHYHPTLSKWTTDDQAKRIDFDRVEGGGKHIDPSAFMAETVTGTDDLTLLLVEKTFGTEPLSSISPVLNELEPLPAAHMSPRTISRLQLEKNQTITISTGESDLQLSLTANEQVAPGVVIIPRHHKLAWQIFSDTRVTIPKGNIRGH